MSEWIEIIEKSLVSGGSFGDRATTIRAMIFGTLVELAEGQMEAYRSDLFHDALWINEQVNGPGEFEWILRDSGTHIGMDANYVIKAFGDQNLKRYRVNLIEAAPLTENWRLVVSEYKATSSYGSDEPDEQTLADADDALRVLDQEN